MSAAHPLLSRRPAREGPALPLIAGARDLTLAQGRTHEICGLARRTCAMWLATQTTGPVIWIAPAWGQDQLHAEGVAQWMDPARLIFVHPRRAEDVLWTMEEVLRAGAVALAVADLPGLPGLTQVRRMHLAAETGAQNGQHSPLGILLTPGTGGAQGVESRWQLGPDHSAKDNRWWLDRLRARSAPQNRWQITLHGAGLQLRVAA